jgi:potassium efflux system protein
MSIWAIGTGPGLAQQAPAAETQQQPAAETQQPPAAETMPQTQAPATGAPAQQGAQDAPATEAPRDGATISGEQLLYPEKLSTQVRQQSAEVQRLVKAVERVRSNDEELEALRPNVDALAAQALQMEETLKPRFEAVERQIKELGEKPKEGAPPETAAVAEERARLEKLQAELQDGIKQSGLTRVRAGQLLGYINQLRVENLGRNLKKREISPLSPTHWGQFNQDIGRVGRQVTTIADNWWAILAQRVEWLAVILVGTALLWWSLSRVRRAMLSRWFKRPATNEPPHFLLRVSTAVGSLPIILAPALVSAVVLYFALDTATLFNDQIQALAFAALKAFAIYFVAYVMAKVVLLPSHPSWRLIGLPDSRARGYLLLIALIAGVYSFDFWFNASAKALHLPLSVVITENFLANLGFAVLLFAFAWMPIPKDTTRTSGQMLRKGIQWLRLPATIAVLAIIGASIAGYLALGRFIATQIMLTGMGAAALLLGHLGARSFSEPTDGVGTGEGARATSLRGSVLTSVLASIANVALVIIAGALLLLSWGFSSAELLSWGRALLFGFDIGGFRFSLIQVLVAIGLFIAVILLTRLVQRWLSQRVFASENFDRGIANSVHSGLGYLGVALAALIGISYAGFDLSNLALIAGALSVGIGFGLNAIASNFISGLIMLIERPIKVGDWVVVGEHQGYVRHISVRATEIETFDRASVLIPNSDFMTSAVQNWTHRNAMGRVVVPVGVAYHEDPERVLELLKEAAGNCRVLLRSPAPVVFFEEFGASSLDFTVRGYIADVNTRLAASTQLRLEIFKILKNNHVEIPFPQQDIHLRDLDGLKGAFARAAAERALQQAAEAATAGGESAPRTGTPDAGAMSHHDNPDRGRGPATS